MLSNRHGHRKNQEVGWLFYVLVKQLVVSSEDIVSHRKLFLDAIKWYRASVVKEKLWAEVYVDDVHFSLLPDLERRVQAGEEVNGAVNGLLATIVKKYRDHLGELRKEDWVNGKTIDDQMNEADALMRNSLPKAK